MFFCRRSKDKEPKVKPRASTAADPTAQNEMEDILSQYMNPNNATGEIKLQDDKASEESLAFWTKV